VIDEGNLVLLIVKSFASQAMGYFALTGLVFLLVWKLGHRVFAARRIQKVERVNGKQLRFEVRNTLVTLLVGTLNAAPIALLYKAGVTKLSDDATQWHWWSIALSFVFLVVFNDAWFFAWHRLLHTPRLMRFAHAVHHKSVDVNPFSSYSFHALEALLLGGWVIPMFMLMPTYLPVVVVLQGFGLAKNIEQHLGYEFMPRWFVRVPPFSWMTTSTFRNLHHTTFNGNYGLYFRFWDRLFGSEVPEYEATFLASRGP
jgi:sterol desaturase/sphingolipid hydroxylase (fatty acid hydroxylase superfamily)